TDFRRLARLQERHDLAVAFAAFQARNFTGVPVVDKDPEAYVRQAEEGLQPFSLGSLNIGGPKERWRHLLTLAEGQLKTTRMAAGAVSDQPQYGSMTRTARAAVMAAVRTRPPSIRTAASMQARYTARNSAVGSVTSDTVLTIPRPYSVMR